MKELQNIIECLLFVADSPIPMEKFKAVIEDATAAQIAEAVRNLEEQYRNRQGGFELHQVAGGWQLRTSARYNEYVKKFLKPAPVRLSRAALETLAIVAYKQPIIRADIEQIRGVDCGGVLRMLLERKLIKVLGRREIPGRPLIYATTKHFLEMFDLKDLKDLPSPKEIAELTDGLTSPETEGGRVATETTQDDSENRPQEENRKSDRHRLRTPAPGQGEQSGQAREVSEQVPDPKNS